MDAVGLHADGAGHQAVNELRRRHSPVQAEDDPQDHPRLARGCILREGPLSIRLTALTHSRLTARPGTPYTQHIAGLTTPRCANPTGRSTGAGPGTAPFRRAAAPCSA